jgi:hypothetical protein
MTRYILIILIILFIIISCNKESDDKIRVTYNNYEWENYFKPNDYESQFFINSLVKYKDDILISAFIRRNNFTIDSTFLFKFNMESFSPIDTLNFFKNLNQYKWKDINIEKKIWLNSDLLIVYDKYENNCCKWHITDLNNPYHSSRNSIDKSGNIWLTSNTNSVANDGLQMLGIKSSLTFFKGSKIYSICFDLKGNLYASTLPSFNEAGIILKYNYLKWDTVYVCKHEADWVPTMCFDKNNNLWFGVLSRWSVAPENGEGLFLLNQEGKIRQFSIYNSDLPSNSVIDIDIDEKDNKWICTYSGGLAKLTKEETWKIFNMDNTPLPIQSVEQAIIDKNYNIWLAVQFMGLARLKE